MSRKTIKERKRRRKLPMFEPKSRYLLMINGRSRDEVGGWGGVGAESPRMQSYEFQGKTSLIPTDRVNFHNKYIRMMHELEALLTGHVDFGDKNPFNDVQDDKVKETLEWHADNSELDGDMKFSNKRRINYEPAWKIYPSEPIEKINGAIDEIVEKATDNDFTLVHISSHGAEDGFVYNQETVFKYDKLLENLDKIKGKKFIFTYACHSGALVDKLQEHDSKRDYGVLTSAQKSQLSMNWNEVEIQDWIVRHIIVGKKPASKLKELGKLNLREGQEPTLVLPFDVIM